VDSEDIMEFKVHRARRGIKLYLELKVHRDHRASKVFRDKLEFRV
jgi:hypothetical protein